MSKIQPIEEVRDEYKEHQAYHQEYHSNCSSCYSENRMLQAFRTVNHQQILEEYPALKNKLGSNLPTGYREE